MFIVKAKEGFGDLLNKVERQIGDEFKVETQERLLQLLGNNPDHKQVVDIISYQKDKKYKRTGPKVIMYQNFLYHIGGIETFLFNLTKHYKDRNITILVDGCELEPLLNLCQYADFEVRDKNKVYECDTLILGNYNCVGSLNRIKAKKIYQMIHADWEGITQLPEWSTFHWEKDPKIDKIICVSETAARGLKKTMGYDSEVIYNILEDNIQDEPFMWFITLSRASAEKGIYRILEMAKQFKAAGKKFRWILCSTLEQTKPEIKRAILAMEEFIIIPPSPTIKDLIRHCDYLVQLSDTESFCYSAFEALQRGVPVILTDFPEAFNIVKEGENGYIIKRDLSNLNIDNIFNKKPTNITYEDRCDYDKWEKTFAGLL